MGISAMSGGVFVFRPAICESTRSAIAGLGNIAWTPSTKLDREGNCRGAKRDSTMAERVGALAIVKRRGNVITGCDDIRVGSSVTRSGDGREETGRTGR